MKLTKRKGFNFFRSYFDVYNELETDADKVAFMDALLDRQFMGVKPKGLNGMARFAYISQTNSIDSQVKGYEDKTKTRLDGSEYVKEITKTPKQPIEKDKSTPTDGGVNTPTYGGKNTPTEQVEEKGKEKGKEKQQYVNNKNVDDVLNSYKNQIGGHESDSWRESFYMKLKYKKGCLSSIVDEFIIDFKLREHKLPKTLKDFKEHLLNWVNVQDRLNKFDKHKLKSSKSLSL